MAQFYFRSGSELLVNTATSGNQSATDVSALPGGGFIVVWVDGSGTGGDSDFAVRAQIFDSSGAKVGGEFRVNTTTTSTQTSGQVDVLPSGRFVVTWTDLSASGGDTSSAAVRGQLYEADGTPVGGEFLVNTVTTGSQGSQTVTELSGGGFVVSWVDGSATGGDTSGSGIKAQLFDADGDKVGGEILVNTTTANSQTNPSIIALASGGFAVAWNETFVDMGAVVGAVRLQLFDADGDPVGTEQQVNSDSDGNFNGTNMAALSSGFVVTWAQQDAPSVVGGPVTFNVQAQRFDADGNKVGSEFTVNTTTFGIQMAPNVAALPGGGFIVTWHGPGEGISGTNVYGQVYDEDGVAVGGEFILSSVTDGTQLNPKVEVLASGDIVVVWTDTSGVGGDSSGNAVKAQLLTLSSGPPTDLLLSDSSITDTAREGTGLITLDTVGGLNADYTYSIVSDSSGGAFAIDGDRIVVQDNSLLSSETSPTVELRIRTTDVNGNSYEETFQLDILDTPEAYTGDSEFLVNTTTQDTQAQPQIVELEGGNFLVTWYEASGGIATGGAGQIYDSTGAVGGELTLAMGTVAALTGGGFVVIGDRFDGDNSGVAAHIYDASGALVSGDIAVNTTTAGNQGLPSVVGLASGGFVVTWTDYKTVSFTGDIRGQLFDASGAKVGSEFLVPTYTGGLQDSSQVTALAGGGFVVSWNYEGSVRAQIYSDAGVRLGGEFIVNTTGSPVAELTITALANGGFVAVWDQNTSSGMFVSISNLTAQIFDADGLKVGGEIPISTELSRVSSIDVSALDWGGFVVSWAGFDDAGTNDPGIRAQVFDSTGGEIGSEIVVSQATAGEQFASTVAGLSDGRFVIGWTDGSGEGGDASEFAVKARIFETSSAAIEGTGGDDVLNGTAGDDEINGLAGNDLIIGGEGADLVRGGIGNDSYRIDDALDTIVELAGEGEDSVYTTVSLGLAAGVSVEFLGTTNADGLGVLDLTGNELAQTIYGNAAANLLSGGGGGDSLNGLAGDDLLLGGDGADSLVGGTGNDRYRVQNSSDLIVEAAGEGDDIAFVQGSYTLGAGVFVETIATVNANETTAFQLVGNEIGQSIYGNSGANLLDGRAGNDLLVGGDGTDELRGGTGNDALRIDNSTDILVELAGEGEDGAYSDLSYTLTAGAHVESLATTQAFATLAIDLTGNELAQSIFGNAGANVIDGGGGNDALRGLGGADSFAFTTALGSGNVDVVADFEAGLDRFLIDNAVFTGLDGGALAAGAFRTGATAQDADDRILYDSSTGALYFDADGNGAGAAVQFAIVSGTPSLSASDFLVI